ncbi:MAG: aldo/keto reductase [Lachnospiraceae bacterium]|nr:aldo/keto reductase [Lachnospiraceae bacterium]
MEFVLNNGVKLPKIGFGTYRATENDGEQTILDALSVGYRYFDTASFYMNEEEIGNAIKKSGVPREDIFLASKVWKTQMGYESTLAAFEESLEKLQTDYLDLYLIHWPKTISDADWKQKLQDTWKAMEELYNAGRIRAIGLSNFLPHHIEALKETAIVKPTVNQLELHVGYMQEAAVAKCREEGIVPQAWSPLGRRRVLAEPIVVSMAEKYQATTAELLLKFLLQSDIAVIPKASSKERMSANLNLSDFEINEEDMSFLRCLPQMGWSGEHPDVELG